MRRQLLGTVAARVAITERADMPIAFRYVPSLEAWRTAEIGEQINAGIADVRWDGARLWRPHCPGGLPIRETDEATLLGMIESRSLSPFGGAQLARLQHGDVPVPEADFRWVVASSDRAARAAAVMAVTEATVICADRFWVRASEPVWLTTFDEETSLVEAMWSDDLDMATDAANVFRADAVDDAVASVTGLPGPGRPPAVFGHIEVLDPRAMRLALSPMRLGSALSGAVTSASENLAYRSTEFIQAWLSARNTLAGGPSQDDLVAAAEAFLPMMGRDLEFARRTLAGALDR